jgi:tetratricopeptide (TPR) repeat protein
MIICNNCGSSVGEGERFCTDCGATMSITSGAMTQPIPIASVPPPVPSEFRTGPPPIPTANTGGFGAAPAPIPGYSQPAGATQPQMEPPPISGSGVFSASTPVTVGKSKALIGIISAVAVVAIALAVYFALESSPTAKLASALQSAVSNGKLVTVSNDDAYSYYYQLRGLDPSHKALGEVAPKVLPQLRTMGEDAFRKKMTVTSEKDTTEDWQKTLRVYEWAHALDASDKQIEARWRFAQGELAKWQLRKDDADKGFLLAAQVNSSWALPQNSLGLLRNESKRWSEAIPYFQRAIDLQSNWEVPYNNMGTAYYYLKNYDAAESWYRQALERNPNWGRPHFWLGSIYEQKKFKPQAIEEYQRALSLARDSSSLNVDEIQKKIERLQR